MALDVDQLVVGSGAGGMTAALAAKSRGLRTLVIESPPSSVDRFEI